ncbi:TPA: 4Fe-4S ferredoxin [Candidatus Edwardsbacteria bacterium]|nr:4Fe-4S ferredoxin [Candidatus Edwardsbacteria bacterium]HBZ85597.1 4Fe-4S ferredoxin [Candidatus Edwardsbacteria bacterium]
MIIVKSEYCPQNHRCPSLRVCPVGAIKQDGFKAPYIDQDRCTNCGHCLQSCRVFQEAPVPANSIN